MSRMELMWYLFSVLTLVANCHGIMNAEEFMKTAFTIKSTAEFFDNWVRLNGSRINITSLEGQQGEEGEKMLVGGDELTMAVYDPCSPRSATQYFGTDNPDPYVMYWPPCTRTNKCGGCCTNSMMTCIPVKISTTAVQTAKTRLPSPGAPFFNFIGMETQIVEEHLACEPRCAVQPGDCNMLQEFSELDCKCLCRTQQMCSSTDQIFDETLCQCKCKSIMDCTGAHIIFDHESCRCRMMSVHEINQVLLAGGLTSEELQEIMTANQVKSTVSKTTHVTNATTATTPQPPTTKPTTTTTTQPPTTTSTTTTTTTTTPPTTTTTTTPVRPLSPAERCALVVCRVSYTPVLLSNGLCHCMMKFSIRLPSFGGLRYRREVLRKRRAVRPHH